MMFIKSFAQKIWISAIKKTKLTAFMSTPSHTSKNTALLIKAILAFFLVTLVLIIYLKTPVREYLEPQRLYSIFQAIRSTWWSPIALISASALGGLLALPATPFTLLIGATYPLPLAILYNFIGLMLGAVADFFLARYLGRDFIARFFKGRLEKFDEKSQRHGFRLMLYLRMVPLFPFISINFGAGLSKIKFKDYFWGTSLGILPSICIVSYFASSLISGTAEARHQVMIHLTISSILLLSLSLLPMIIKKRDFLFKKIRGR